MTSPKSKTPIVIVDDHPIVRDHLKQLINYEPDLVVCAEAADAKQALCAVAECKPALVIVDLTLKDSHGIELIKDLALRHPQTRILVLSMHEESLWAERVLHAGASGYMMKDELTSQVIIAIRRVLSGEVYVSKPMVAHLLHKFSRPAKPGSPAPPDFAQLSDREMEVLQLIGAGHGPSDIAALLHLDVKTVESYRARIRQKLQVHDAGELRRQAIAWFHRPGGI
jgi:DNA-binding NarL/FixJ family response regulator